MFNIEIAYRCVDEECEWNWQLDPGVSPAMDTSLRVPPWTRPCCPECGGTVEVQRVGV